jgi:hypothetical protein
MFASFRVLAINEQQSTINNQQSMINHQAANPVKRIRVAGASVPLKP